MRWLNIYLPFGILEVQKIFQYNAWFWVGQLRNIIAMMIMTAFWAAIYAGQNDLAGLSLTTTLNYVILARALGNANASSVYWWMAEGISKGQLELEFLRPVDFQMMHLAREFSAWGLGLLLGLPSLLIGIFVFQAKLPTDPMAYLAFLITFFLGGIILFGFELMLGCLGFYTTEMWGLSVLSGGIGMFLSGALIPLEFMPEAVRNIANLTPFAQALYVPISFLSGVRNPDQLGSTVLLQLGLIIVFLTLSRIVFARAARVLTMQGG